MAFESSRLSALFLHFYDIHFLEDKGLEQSTGAHRSAIMNECSMALRLALMAANEVYVPAASYFESEICGATVARYKELFEHGQIWLVGGGANAAQFIADKLRQYDKNSVQARRYKQALKSSILHPPFLNKRTSTTGDIVKGWLARLPGEGIGSIVTGTDIALPLDFEKRWESVPLELGNKAFILENVDRTLLDGKAEGTIRNRLHGVINAEYFASYTSTYRCGIVEQLVYLAAGHGIPTYGQSISYRHLLAVLRRRHLRQKVDRLTPSQLAAYSQGIEWSTVLAESIEEHYRDTMRNQETTAPISDKRLQSARVGVIVALPKEYEALKQVLDAKDTVTRTGRGSGRRYACATVTGLMGRPIEVVVAMLPSMGNNQAAIRATQMLEHCPNVSHMIMCGIAGAVPAPTDVENHVRLGDIVVSGEGGVVQYDMTKDEITGITNRSPVRPPSSTLVEALQHIEAEEMTNEPRWHSYVHRMERGHAVWVRPSIALDVLKDDPDAPPTSHPVDPKRKDGIPRVFKGTIAAANVLLKNPARRDELRAKYKVKAVEMEGSGIADATWAADAGYLVIRGTCDYCNPTKNDDWQNYAALVAAAYCRRVIEEVNL